MTKRNPWHLMSPEEKQKVLRSCLQTKPPTENIYSKMAEHDFQRILLSGNYDPWEVPGVYELCAEHFNNEVLDAWLHEQEEE